jgi:two-component system nitrogen regulation sensor histidine kinase NtrY
VEGGRGVASYTAALAAAYVSVVLLLVWARELRTSYIVASLVLLVIGAWLTWRQRRWGGVRGDLMYVGCGVMLLALVSATAIEHRLYRVASDWTSYSKAREGAHAAELGRRMDGLVERGRRVVEAAVQRSASGGDTLFDALGGLQRRSGVQAIVAFDSVGQPVAWAGDHRGPIPDPVRSGSRSIFYGERPLFGYLYFMRPVPRYHRRVAVAVLLETDLPGEQSGPGFASRFARVTGERPRFAVGGAPDAAWSLVAAGDTIVHATFAAPDQAGQRTEVATAGRRIVSMLLLVVFIFLSAAWLRPVEHRRGAASAMPLLALAAALLVAPLGRTLGLQRLFSPMLFVLPMPGDIVLESVLVTLLPAAALMATYHDRSRRNRSFYWRIVLGGAGVAVVFAGGMWLLQKSAASDMLQGGAPLWLGFQVAALVLFTLVARLALPRGRGVGRRSRWLAGGAGLALVFILVVVLLAVWRLGHVVDPALLALWAVPCMLLALALAPYDGRGQRLVRWLAAGFLAATAVVPHTWTLSGEAQLRNAEQQLNTLGTRADPFLYYVLRRFADEVQAQQERGADSTRLLYGAWLASGLAREPYPLNLTLWSTDDQALVVLPLGGVNAPRERPPAFLTRILDRARRQDVSLTQAVHGEAEVNEVLAVPLEKGRVVSVVVAPRRQFERTSPLAQLLGGESTSQMRLELVPASVLSQKVPGRVRWRATDTGWRSETTVPYPTGYYEAHLEYRLPPAGVRFARGMLVIAADLAFLLLLWAVGRLARGDPPVPPGGWAAWLASFRARVTLALFAFFLLPTVIFGWATYQALAEEVVRSARVVAERAVAEAATTFPDTDLPELSARIGEEVLYLHKGELIEASSPEALDLGLYGAWMPPSVYRLLETGEEIHTVDTRELAGRHYLVAYRRMLPAGTLGVPVWLSAGDVAVRQRELLHLVLFAALVGGLLSLGLSVLVGRALAGPLGALRRGAAAVGAGRLSVRLPAQRGDEFGELFASFNRMARRLQRARARELHTARVLAWGQMARQVAHEIKNPLTPIKLAVQHVQRVFKDRRPDFEEVLDTNAKEILAEIERLSEIARVFSRYGAPAEAAGPLEAVNVPVVVREALTLYMAGDEDIEYRLEVDAPPPAMARASELKEVVLNLLENARLAVEGFGSVGVRVRGRDGGVVVSVQDDGEGIPRDQLARIFEPHFSTRSSGTGLGLAIVRRLVEGWGGAIEADSEPGVGTTIRLWIPGADADDGVGETQVR